MKNFIFGMLTTFGVLVLCGKSYNRGVKDTMDESKKRINALMNAGYSDEEIKTYIKKEKKTKKEK